MSEKHDDKLYEILKEEKNLVRFFESIFGFLSRRLVPPIFVINFHLFGF